MLRSLTMAMALGAMMFGMSSAEAAKYCAGYTGGSEKAEARSNCVFDFAESMSRQRQREGRRPLL